MKVSLWDEVRVGGLALRNRAVMPAMGTAYATSGGEVTDRLIAYLRRRGEGGVGLIVTEVCAVHSTARGFDRELGIYDDRFLPGLERLARAVKDTGAAVAAQLHHAGRATFPQVIGEQPLAPSPIPTRAMGQVPRAMSVGEIAEMAGCFAAAARRAREAGFDAVEVHGAHGYLINQFISPLSNLREDEYGGDDAGRFRFAREVVREIKREAGADFPVIFRFSASEEVGGGYDLDYILPLLELLEQDGADALHVSCGVIDSPGNPTCPGIHHPPGINVERAAAVKARVKVPVIVVGKLHDPRLAQDVLAAGKADMVAFGRQHLADPLFLAKAAEGRFEDIRFCLSCNQGCIERLGLEFKEATCVINPSCGSEWRERRGGPANRGPFLVAGAGAAGLQAAITLGEAGAEVRLMEKEEEPGGQLRAASRPDGKQAYADWVGWAVRRLGALGIGIELGREVDEETVASGGWAGLVAATGAVPCVPAVPGCGLAINAEAREVLLGEREAGERTLIVGAGPVGMETAEYLIQRGRKVTVVEEMEYPPVSPLTSHGYHLHRTLRKGGELLLSTTITRVEEDGAVISTRGEERKIEADTVIWAIGSIPVKDVREAAARAGLKAVEAGDAREPRLLIDAVHEGAKAAESLLYGEEEP